MNKTNQEKKFEYTNICPHCGAENTIYPKWIGRKRMYVCVKEADGCGKATKGITKTEWAKRTGTMTPSDQKKVVELLGKLKQLNPTSSLFEEKCS